MKTKMVVEIDNITEPQAIALETLLRIWVVLGSQGASRWTAFYADGDGNFHPKITVNGKAPEATTLIDIKKCWQQTSEGEMFLIDFDSIAWVMRGDND